MFFWKTSCFLLLASYGVSSALAELESPTYDPDNQRLIVPAVSADGLPGAIQNAILENVDGEYFRLTSLETASLLSGIASVELVSKGEAPVNIYLNVEGWISGCEEVGLAVQKREGDIIYVNLYFEYDPEPAELCAAALFPFNKVVPLSTYDLEAGEYTYIVNNSYTGTFALEVRNVLD